LTVAVREARPVAVELRRLDVLEMRRCIDFIAGAGYVMGAQVEKITDRVYLVSSSAASVTKRQRQVLRERFD
jgi:FtsZ-interacting cell division protein YlmF